MRLPIVEYPHVVSDNLAHFAPVFATREQQKHFCEYVTGLIAGDKATVTAINDLFVNQNDQSALNKFLTQARWDEQELNRQRVQMEIARLQRRPVSEQAGRLILDDTFAHPTKWSMEGLAYLRDRRLGHNVWVHDVVTSYYVNRSDHFPVDLRLYFQFNRKYQQQVLEQRAAQLQAAPTLANYRQYLTTLLSYHYRQQLYQAKTELGAQLVEQAVVAGVPFSVVLFDNWFLRLPVVEAIEAAHKDWVGGCPKDRLVLSQNHWTQVQEFMATIPASAYRPYRIGTHLFWVFSLVMPMKNLHRRRVRILAVYADKVKIEQTPLFLLPSVSTGKPNVFSRRILTAGRQKPSMRTSRDIWALKLISYDTFRLSDDTGIFVSWRIRFSVTKLHRDTLVGRCVVSFSQLVNVAKRLSMNCSVISSPGLFSNCNRG
jgi:hypothetical protein